MENPGKRAIQRTIADILIDTLQGTARPEALFKRNRLLPGPAKRHIFLENVRPAQKRDDQKARHNELDNQRCIGDQ